VKSRVQHVLLLQWVIGMYCTRHREWKHSQQQHELLGATHLFSQVLWEVPPEGP
jgi:hypothetical protein